MGVLKAVRIGVTGRSKKGILLILLASSSLWVGCVEMVEPLPHPLYFLDSAQGSSQVWRMERDGLSKTAVTQEEAGVEAFSVSPADGSLAIVSANRLFILDNDGSKRRLVADATQVPPKTEDYVFRGFITDPIFSPDGRTLAYAFDGLHLFNIKTGEDHHVLTNLGNLLDETFVFAKEAYFPGPWSPDSRKLLIIMGYYEGSTLAVMEPGAEEPFTHIRSSGPMCCEFRWTTDGRYVLISNGSYGTLMPGLWRANSTTGEVEQLMGMGENGEMNFVSGPHQNRKGELTYFYANLMRFDPEVGIPKMLVHSKADGTDRKQLRPEEFRVIETLWAQDGSLALILQPAQDVDRQVVLVRTDGIPLKVLLEGERIRDLMWGP